MRFRHFVVGLVVLAGASVWYVRAGQESVSKSGSRQDAADLSRHGEYLVNSVAMCGDCHTPRNDQGRPDRARLLRGATVSIRPKKASQEWADESPDITGCGLADKWGEEGMIKFLTTGVNPDGHKAMPPMPAFRLDARDARAVFVYLKSLPR